MQEEEKQIGNRLVVVIFGLVTLTEHEDVRLAWHIVTEAALSTGVEQFVAPVPSEVQKLVWRARVRHLINSVAAEQCHLESHVRLHPGRATCRLHRNRSV